MTDRRILLASTSKYRAELLRRLGVAFDIAAPGVDESPLAGEQPAALAARLAHAKAKALAANHKGTLVIGSDQVLALADQCLGKPGSHDNAVKQLRLLSSQTVVFHSALCVIDSDNMKVAQAVVPVQVRFRALSDNLIERYLRTEEPYDVAGSAKSEGLGIALLERIESSDPTALIGLPLIALVDLLAEHDYRLLDYVGAQ